MAEEFDDVNFLDAEVAAPRSAAAPPRTASPATDNASKVVQPKPQAMPSRQGPSAILVSTQQKGNAILNHVKSLPWEYSDIPCDYVLGATTCALFLSLKYHPLRPDYIYSRIRQLGKLYNLRILLTMVDITNHEEVLKELSKTSMINNLTLILSWSSQEAGRYFELFKSYEHASPASIRAHQAETYQESLTEFVTSSTHQQDECRKSHLKLRLSSSSSQCTTRRVVIGTRMGRKESQSLDYDGTRAFPSQESGKIKRGHTKTSEHDIFGGR
ncbi:ssDNA endonuclease and repair protein rad10 [Exophiala xenobiotica]|nr:ssDNA endonuclease and repair protein rad10 [Exophiala xenobiotica]KAK5550731.1 ssDNA endonuclease and repair protein rad10 [Exophiala xenobiotica]